MREENMKARKTKQPLIILIATFLLLSCNNESKKLPDSKGFVYSDDELLNEKNTGLKSGGPGGISFSEGQINKIFGHTHPRYTGASQGDNDALRYFNQSKQYIFEGGSDPIILLNKTIIK